MPCSRSLTVPASKALLRSPLQEAARLLHADALPLAGAHPRSRLQRYLGTDPTEPQEPSCLSSRLTDPSEDGDRSFSWWIQGRAQRLAHSR